MADADGPLAGQVALVAGATRGAGRGIALELAAAGAKVSAPAAAPTRATGHARPTGDHRRDSTNRRRRRRLGRVDSRPLRRIVEAARGVPAPSPA